MRQQSKRIAISTLFGAVIFVSKAFLPFPVDKILIIVPAILLGLGALLLKKMGATYIATIGGTLTALWRPALAPFTLLFAVLYGFSIDGFFLVFKVNSSSGHVKTGKLVASLTLSTALTGFLSYYVTVLLLGLHQRNPDLEVSVLVAGILSGALAGYLVSIIWNKYLKNVKY